MAEAEDRGFIRDPVADQVNACKPAHRRHLDQCVLHRWITEVIPLLHQVNPQHGLQRVGRAAAFGTSLGVVGLNQIDQRLPGNNGLHLAQETLPLGAFPRGGLLVITVGGALREALTELLAAHEPSHALRSQSYCRADWPGYPESP
jgi:hypothetical protein